MMTTIERWLGAALLALVCSASANAQAPASDDAVEFSEAETRLWMTDQLKSVEAPARLVYAFTKSGSFEPGFEDEVRFTIDKINSDGTKAASLHFFNGERNVPVPPVGNTTVNPVLGVYLQGDVYEMNRLTDPDGAARERWRYFHRRIKLALSESAAVTPAEFSFGGREYAGYRIHFEPYRNDPHRNEFEKFADKSYTVLVADDLPGYVYRIETLVPDADGKAEPLIHEVLELKEVEPLGAPAAS